MPPSPQQAHSLLSPGMPAHLQKLRAVGVRGEAVLSQGLCPAPSLRSSEAAALPGWLEPESWCLVLCSSHGHPVTKGGSPHWQVRTMRLREVEALVQSPSAGLGPKCPARMAVACPFSHLPVHFSWERHSVCVASPAPAFHRDGVRRRRRGTCQRRLRGAGVSECTAWQRAGEEPGNPGPQFLIRERPLGVGSCLGLSSVQREGAR